MINIKPLRVLHIVGNMNMGGQETFIMNIYRNINRNKIQFDFVVHSQEKGYYDEEIEKLGGKIYRIPRLSKKPIKYIILLSKIIKKNNYQILHRHTCSSIIVIDLLIAKFCKMSKLIVHSHSNSLNKNKFIHLILRNFINALANKKYACSISAGKWLYGNGKYEVISNGIEISKYVYNEKTREKIRKQEKAENKKIIGHIGRFEDEKNHEFIIKLISKIKTENENIEFWLIGDGKLKDKIYEMVEKNEIKRYVKFLGIKDNINEYLQAMDMFVFPSKYEGLGISLIEAQISGLQCIVSENIPEEAIITENVKIEKLNVRLWENYIIKKYNEKNRNIDINNDLIRKYDIENVIEKLSKYYLGE